MADFLSQLESSFDTKPVGIVDFAQSRKFCGKPLYPRQKLLLKLFFLEDLTDYEERILDYWISGGRGGEEVIVCPGVRERIAWCKEHGYKHFSEIVFVGGRRSSKGHLTAISMTKKMYDTLRIDDPGIAFGISPDKNILFSCIATSQDQAKANQYGDFSSMVNSCAAMQKYIQKTQELEFSVKTQADLRRLEMWKRQGRKVMKDTAKLRGVALPANQASIRGTATLVADFDEFAFFMQGESAQSDKECYEALKPSMDQFGRESLLFVKSSPYSKVGKFFERWEVAMATDNDTPVAHNVLGIQVPSWAAYEGWWESDADYTGPKSTIMVSPDWDPDQRNPDGSYFYLEDDRESIIKQRQEERENPEKYKVEYRGKWAETIDAYLLPEKIDEMYSGRPIENGYEPLYTNYLESSYNYKYVAHLDPSSTTAGFGFAMGHIEQLTVDGVTAPHVIIDIAKRWSPAEFGGVISWEDVVQEILSYAKQFRPTEITTDQFQSLALIQGLRSELRARNISETRVYEKTATAAVNWKRWETFKTALYRGLVHAPHDTDSAKWCALELKYLQVVNTGMIPRVDKQSVGEVQTKDIADAVSTVVETLIGNLMASSQREEMMGQTVRVGAQGGYPMMLQNGQHPLGNLSLNTMHNYELAQLGRAARGKTKPSPVRTWGARPRSRRLGS
jgi:hypothetical protein